MDEKEVRFFIEAALLAAGRPLSVDQLQGLFDGRSAPEKSEIRKAIDELIAEYEPRGVTIGEVASGFRIQVKAAMADRLKKLWEERPPRYSRALFETLALIAYRQPITRAEIEEVRGVSVSSNIVRSLMERDWIRVVGHRDVPGRPAMFGTTRTFLDYFGLKKLDDLPPLADLADWESLRVQLNLPDVEESGEVEVAEEFDHAVVTIDPYAEDAAEAEAAVESHPGDSDDSVTGSEDVSEASNADEAKAEFESEQADDQLEAETEAQAAEPPGPAEEVEELVVSEWPDPADSKGVASLETRDKDDRDASAGGG